VLVGVASCPPRVLVGIGYVRDERVWGGIDKGDKHDADATVCD